MSDPGLPPSLDSGKERLGSDLAPTEDPAREPAEELGAEGSSTPEHRPGRDLQAEIQFLQFLEDEIDRNRRIPRMSE